MVFNDRLTSLRLVAVLAALVAALAVSACGDDDDGGDAKGSNANSAQAPDGGNANASGDAGDGSPAGDGSNNASSGDTEPVNLKQVRLTPAQRRRLQARAPKVRPYTGYGFDRGSKKDKTAIMSLFRKMQRDFYSGDAMGFCRQFGTGLYALPNLKAGDGKQRIKECAAIVSRVAKDVATGKVRWPFGAVQWVRVYRDPGVDPFGGITVRSSGREIRVSFVELEGRWRPDFRVPQDLRTLSSA